MHTTLPTAIILKTGLEEMLENTAAYDLLESVVAVFDACGRLRYGNAAFSRFNLAVRDSMDNLHQKSALLECPQFSSWLRTVAEAGQNRELRQVFHYSARIQVELTVCARPLVESGGTTGGILLTLGEESIVFRNHHIASGQAAMRALAERIKVLDREKLNNAKLIRSLLTDTPVAIVLLDAQRRILQINRTAERMFGFSSISLVGQTCERLLPCYHQCGTCPALDESRKIESMEIDGFTAARQAIPLLRSVSTISDDSNGKVIIEAFIDISERKLAENALYASEQKLSSILENVDAYIYVKDLGGRYQFANKPVRELWHASIEDIVGFGDEKFFEPETARNIRLNDAHVLKRGETVRVEEINTVPTTGKTSIYQSTKLPLRREDGTIYGLCGISTDITERKLAEENLRENEQRLRAIIETEPECLTVVDRTGKLLEINAIGLDMLEAGSLEEARQHLVLEYVLPEDREAFKSLHRKVMSGGNAILEFRITGLKGAGRWLETHATALKDINGEVTSVLAVTRDISERKLRDAQMESYRLNLEEMVRERTARLYEAMEQSEVASRAKGYFINNVSHEFRTPMNAVIGYSHILKKKITDPVATEQIVKIQQAARQMLSIIDNILEFSESESHQLALRITGFDLGHLVAQINEEYRGKAQAKKLPLSVEIDSGIPVPLQGDPERLHLILANFLDNSLKFTSAGSVVLRVRLVRIEAGQALVRFEIQDTGIGISADKLQMIFDPFVQVDPTDSRAFSGIGIGLSTNETLVKLMGGEISVESEPDKGSVFRFTLPFTTGRMENVSKISVAAPVASLSIDSIASGGIVGLLEEFDSLLNSSDTRINKRIVDSNAVLQAAFGNEALRFYQRVEQYDYEGASEALEDLKRQLPQFCRQVPVCDRTSPENGKRSIEQD